MTEKNISPEYNKLRQVRQALHLKQKEFAASLGITQSYLSAVELGKKEITSRLSRKLIELFRISPEWLMNNEGSIFNTNPVQSGQQDSEYTNLKTGVLAPEDGQHGSDSLRIASLGFTEADPLTNAVQAAAAGGIPARRWADRRFIETRIYKQYPGVSSDTLNDYFLTRQLGQYIDQMLVELHNDLHYRIDQVLDQAIDNEISLEQAADKIREITTPLSQLQGKLEAMDEMMFDIVKSTVQQYPGMLENVKRTLLYHGLQERNNRQEENQNVPKTAA